jgi:hypothetical protein
MGKFRASGAFRHVSGRAEEDEPMASGDVRHPRSEDVALVIVASRQVIQQRY